MASKLPQKITLLALTFAMMVALIPVSSAHASGQDETSPLKTHIIKFYLDPTLSADMDFAKQVLPKYVDDMNFILAKNTNRRLAFDPETGIITTDKKPQTDSGRAPLPTDDFEIWAHAVHTDQALSFGGYAGMDLSGAAALAGLRWTKLYDPAALDANDVVDYTTQIDHMLHEMAHVFGAGIGEYYSLLNVKDTTTTAPLMDITINNANDSFWSDKPDFLKDPLLRFTKTASREEYLATVQFSNLTAAILGGSYRNGIPSFEQFTIQVLDANDQPVPNANVKVWAIQSASPYENQLTLDGMTDSNGQVTIDWGTPISTHNANNSLRLIKVYLNGEPAADPQYVSIYDADIAKLVKQSDTQFVNIHLNPAKPKITAEAFVSSANTDGWTLESRESANAGGTMDVAGSTFRLGDDATRKQYRAILSFNTSSIPDDAVITKVSLKVKRQGITGGGNPVSIFRGFLVDVRNGSFGDTSLELGDWQSDPSKTVGPFNIAPEGGWYALDLTAAITQINKLNDNNGLTQIRLRFKLDDNNNSIANYLTLFSGNANQTNRPQLTVEYYVP